MGGGKGERFLTKFNRIHGNFLRVFGQLLIFIEIGHAPFYLKTFEKRISWKLCANFPNQIRFQFTPEIISSLRNIFEHITKREAIQTREYKK